MIFLNVNFLTVSLLSFSKRLHLFAVNLIHNRLMAPPHLTLLLALNFVALSQCRKSWFANWYMILPPKAVFSITSWPLCWNVLRWLISAFDLQNCEQITVIWVWDCSSKRHSWPLLKKQQPKNKTNKKAGLDAKKQNKNKTKNRPVANLQFVSKLLEKVVLHQLRNQLLTNNLCENFQSAYRAHHSRETALLDVTNCLLGSTGEGQVCVLTLLDLPAAFDTLYHSILLARVHDMFGISGKALQWFSSNLSDRARL